MSEEKLFQSNIEYGCAIRNVKTLTNTLMDKGNSIIFLILICFMSWFSMYKK